MPNRDGKRLKERVLACAEKVEEDDMTSDEWEVVSRLGMDAIVFWADGLLVRRSCLSIPGSLGC